jgi:hypothetical protein
MSISRRGFLQSAFVSALAAGLFSPSAISVFAQKSDLKDARGYFQLPAQVFGERLFHLSRASFEPYLQSGFRVTVGPYKVVNLTLVKVQDRRTHALKGMPRPEGESFTLLFKATDKLSDLQQTYVLEHDALGKFSLFLVNASESETDVYYLATINRTQAPDSPAKIKM